MKTLKTAVYQTTDVILAAVFSVRDDTKTAARETMVRWLGSFSWSMPPKVERKLGRVKKRFGKIATTVVLDTDDIGMTSELS